MQPALLSIEFNSVAGGIFVADLLVKQAEVTILESDTVCPGKYMVTLTGDVDALKSAIEAALESEPGETITEHFLLPHVDPRVISAVGGAPDYGVFRSVGVIEAYGVATCIRAADAGVKTSGADVVEIRLANAQGGKCVVIFSGAQHEVEEALAAGRAVASEMQAFINATIIERPHECLAGFLEA